MGVGTRMGVYLKAISSSGSLLLLLLLHFHGGEIITGASAATVAVAGVGAGTEQKCDKVVMVETPELLSYLGNVTFTVPTPFRGRWKAVIKFTSPYTFIGGWGVTVQSFGRKAYAIFDRNDEENLKPGDKVIFQFRVLYGMNIKVPKVLSIKWENISICGPPISGGKLSHSIPTKPYSVQHLHSSEEDPEEEEEDDQNPPSFDTQGEDDNDDDQSGRPSSDQEGDDADDNIQTAIQQHVATNRLRLFNWKPAVKKD